MACRSWHWPRPSTTHVERHIEVWLERVEERVEGPAGGVELGLLLLREHLGRVAHLGPRLLVEDARRKQVLDGTLPESEHAPGTSQLQSVLLQMFYENITSHDLET